MITYRGLKKLLGETSLERKCRFLFGIALFCLITGSFWLQGSRTRQLVEQQKIIEARDRVPDILRVRHYQSFNRQKPLPTVSGPAGSVPAVSGPAGAENATSAESKESVSGGVSGETAESDNVNDVARTDDTGTETSDHDAVTAGIARRFSVFEEQLGMDPNFNAGVKWNLILQSDTPDDDGFDARQLFESDEEKQEYYVFATNQNDERILKYYAAIRVSDSCRVCHDGNTAQDYADVTLPAMASVTSPMVAVEGQLSQSRAILFASAIFTTFLAMLVAYAIVRYIIVKPVLHLKDVSDEIARGNLNLRAEINTGDEFEELSHAFNRMLRHMTTVNDELRSLNDNLDAKVDLLAQANMELFTSNELKDEFLATMSHELRTPLNSILGFSDILAGAKNLDERQTRYVDNIRTSGRSLMVQINDLLDLAKIESGRMELQPCKVALGELLETQVTQVTPLADQKNIELRINHPPQNIPALYQDGGKLRQIMTNLLSNAIKFTPEGGRVRVSSALKGDDVVEICVEDTGIGIPLHEQENIFEKFRQGSTVPGKRDHVKREFGGTGLGLSIVRELSRLLGGDVSLQSEFGKGSMFQVTIPLVLPEEKSEPAVILDPGSAHGTGRITTVDLMGQTETSGAAAQSDSETARTEDSQTSVDSA